MVSYDVDNDLKPKYLFLVKALDLSVRDLCNYPGYLSLPLIDIILTRTLFLVKELDQHPDIRIHFVGSDKYSVTEILGLENSSKYSKDELLRLWRCYSIWGKININGFFLKDISNILINQNSIEINTLDNETIYGVKLN